MEQNTKSDRHALILTCLSGCAFSLFYKWSIAEYGWNLLNGFQLFATVMFGTILQYLSISLRTKHLLLAGLCILGMVQKVEPLTFTMWIGLNLGMIQDGVQKENKRNFTLVIFTISIGLTYLLLGDYTPPFLICVVFIILPSVLLSNRLTVHTTAFGSIPKLIHGAILGVLFIALWNQQSPYTQPQEQHLLFAVITFLGCNSIQQTLFKSYSDAKDRLYTKLGWSALFIWPFIGYASVQDWSGDTILFGSMILSGLLGLLLHPSSSGRIGFAIGLLLFRVLSNQISELPVITLLTVLWILFEGFKSTTLLAGALTIFCFFTGRGPIHQFIPTSKFVSVSKDQQYIVTQKTWDKHGWLFFGQKIKMSKDVTIPLKNDLLVENLPITKASRRWSNEVSFINFVENLLPEVGQIAILNDISGQVNISLGEANNLQIAVFTPNTFLTRMVAQTYPKRKNAWLRPNRLLKEDKGYFLPQSSTYKMVIESIHHPWVSSISNGFSARHFEHVQNALTANGLAIFIVHLEEVPNNGMDILSANLESTFEHTLYMLPKDNIDAIMVLCSNTPITYRALKEQLDEDKESWLGQIILKKFPRISDDLIDLSPQNRPAIPFAHLTSLAGKIPNPNELWEDIPQTDALLLSESFDNHREYLELISAGMSGALQNLKQANLPSDLTQNLITPHLQSAKKHIQLAQNEGQSSNQWEEAKRYALTAQLIAPNNIEPWLLLGDIALGEGFLDKAKEKYNRAKDINPDSLEALNGLARIAGLENDTAQVESLLLAAQQLEPGNWIPNYNLATFLLQENRIDEAQSLFQTTLDLQNGDNIKTRTGFIECFIAKEKWTRALLEVDRIIQTTSKPSATLWFLRGRIHFGLELWDKAEVDFRKATLEDPQFHAARGSIGLIKIAQGDLEGAAQAFRSTLRFDPKNEVARQNLQRVLEQLSKTPSPK